MGEILEKIGYALGYGGTVAVIGMFIVFVGLIILIGFISLTALYFRRNEKNAARAVESAAPPAPSVAAAPAIEHAEDNQADNQVYNEDSGELIAAITAAIQLFDDSDKPLIIKSVRRVSGWTSAARAEQVYKL